MCFEISSSEWVLGFLRRCRRWLFFMIFCRHHLLCLHCLAKPCFLFPIRCALCTSTCPLCFSLSLRNAHQQGSPKFFAPMGLDKALETFPSVVTIQTNLVPATPQQRSSCEKFSKRSAKNAAKFWRNFSQNFVLQFPGKMAAKNFTQNPRHFPRCTKLSFFSLLQHCFGPRGPKQNPPWARVCSQSLGGSFFFFFHNSLPWRRWREAFLQFQAVLVSLPCRTAIVHHCLNSGESNRP